MWRMTDWLLCLIDMTSFTHYRPQLGSNIHLRVGVASEKWLMNLLKSHLRCFYCRVESGTLTSKLGTNFSFYDFISFTLHYSLQQGLFYPFVSSRIKRRIKRRINRHILYFKFNVTKKRPKTRRWRVDDKWK